MRSVAIGVSIGAIVAASLVESAERETYSPAMTKVPMVCFLALVACATDPTEPEDGRDDSFVMDGKSDSGGITEGSPEALGVLRVANGTSESDLRTAHVSKRAAHNIVAYRNGSDGLAGTSDDARFDTLAQLDAVKYVGPIAFEHMLDYARAEGYVAAADAYTLPSCTPMTFDELAARFKLSSSSPDGFWQGVDVGGWTLTGRSRDVCDAVIGCTPWRDPSVVPVQQLAARGGYESGSARMLPDSGTAMLEYDTVNSWFRLRLDAPEPGMPADTIRARCGNVGAGQVADNLECVLEVWFPPPPENPGDVEGTILEFQEYRAGQHVIGSNSTMMMWNARICSDGRYEFVTKLGSEISPSIYVGGGNNLNQISITGTL
jgi:hypothetical protein